MEQYVIYKITNNKNGKSYIGRTKDLERRIKEHITRPTCSALHRAIKKHGIENFSIGILVECEDFDTMIESERELILFYNTMVPNGYNLVLETDQGRSPSQETRKKMSDSGQHRLPKGSSGYTGVKIDKNKKGFMTRVNFQKKTYYKYFKTAEEAAEAYDKINLHLRGVGCGLNFPYKLKDYLQENLEQYFELFCHKNQPSSKYKGVAYHKLLKKWRAYYYLEGKQIIIGNFLTEQEAQKASEKYYNNKNK